MTLWSYPGEEQHWLEATRKVMAMPEWPRLPLWQRLELIAAAAGERPRGPVRKIAKPVPEVKPLSEAEYNRRMDELRAQADGMREPGDEREEWWQK